MRMKWCKQAVMFLAVILLIGSSPIHAANANQTSDILKKYDQKLATEIGLPGDLEQIIGAIFRIQDTPLTISLLITLGLILFMIIMVFTTVLKLTPFFETKKLALLGSIIIGLLIGLSGAIKGVALFILNSLSFFKFFETYNAGALGFAILLIALVSIILSYILRKINQVQATAMKKETGRQMGTFLGMIKSQYEWFRYVMKVNK